MRFHDSYYNSSLAEYFMCLVDLVLQAQYIIACNALKRMPQGYLRPADNCKQVYKLLNK